MSFSLPLGRTKHRLVGALAVVAALTAVLTPPLSTPASSQTSLVGAAGIDAGLPATPSALTLPGRGRFSEMKVTVNQTANLTNQAVSVSWTGAPPATSLTNNFVQMFQCWGDDDGTVPGNPGPPPEQCQFGGEPVVSSVLGKIPASTRPSYVYSRVLSQQSWGTPYFDQSAGFYDASNSRVWKPFKAVDGKVVDAQLKLVPPACDGCLNIAWQNSYFDFNTTNEKPWARTYANGKGSELFQLYTGLEAPGLGCGQKKEVKADGSTVVPKCWLVVVPRGTAAEENPAPLAPPGYPYVATSPLSPSAWANRIAFPLEFNPVDSPCALGSASRQIVGSELSIAAMTSWQPKLCATPGSPPYTYSAVSDDQARRQLASGSSTAPGLAVLNRPLAADSVDQANPPVYSPLTLSGLVIGFNIERVPTNAAGTVVDPAETDIAASRVTTLNLTPRLVAKLLTQSYSTPFYGTRPAGYEWVAGQPTDLTVDPDFQQFNPEFAVMTVGSRRNTSAVTVQASSSDGALAVWNWILADPEAKAWLGGAADPWGMKVNPRYTTASTNPSGAPFGTPVPNTFPKNDPYCYQDTGFGDIIPRPLCLLDIQPYGLSLAGVAAATRAGNDGALTSHDPLNFSQQTANSWWAADGPQPLGTRSILSITDSASAYRYGLQTARLSRAGDNGATRTFIAADNAGFTAGVKAMVDERGTGVLVPDPSAKVDGAYPLTLISYAAATPKTLEASARTAYADFVKFAAESGQTPGVEFGQLPPGYAPLPADLKAQATAAEAHIRAGTSPGGSGTTTTTTAASTQQSSSTTATTNRVTTTSRATSSGAGTLATLAAVASPSATVPPAGLTPPPSGAGDGAAAGPAATDGSTTSTTAGDSSESAVEETPSSAPAAVTPAVLVARLGRYAIALLLLVGLISATGVMLLDERIQRQLGAKVVANLPVGLRTRLLQTRFGSAFAADPAI